MRKNAIERAVQAAKDRLDKSVNAVATAAQLLTQVPGVRVQEGVVVELGEWRELQDALGEWRAATNALLTAVKTAARGPKAFAELALRRAHRAAYGGVDAYAPGLAVDNVVVALDDLSLSNCGSKFLAMTADAEPSWRPTIRTGHESGRRLADAYDAFMEATGDDRRAERRP